MPAETRSAFRPARAAVAALLVVLAAVPAAARFEYFMPARDATPFAAALDELLPADARAWLAEGVSPRPVPEPSGDRADWRARLEEIAWSQALACEVTAPPGQAVAVRLWPRGTPRDAHRFAVIREPRRWTSEPGETLRETLTRWAADADRDLDWKAGFDWRLEDPVRLGGSWRSAVTTLLEALQGVAPAPAGELVRGGQVLVIRTRESGGREAGEW